MVKRTDKKVEAIGALTPKALFAELYDMAEKGIISDAIIGFRYSKELEGEETKPGHEKRAGVCNVWWTHTEGSIVAYMVGLINLRHQEFNYNAYDPSEDEEDGAA